MNDFQSCFIYYLKKKKKLVFGVDTFFEGWVWWKKFASVRDGGF